MLELWTDGSCVAATRVGGWAYVVVEDGQIIHANAGARKDTTSNIMELCAIVYGVSHITKSTLPGREIHLHTDSQVCVSWLFGENDPKANRDIVMKAREVVLPHLDRMVVRKVAGHTGLLYNEIVDKLARQIWDGSWPKGVTHLEHAKEWECRILMSQTKKALRQGKS